MSSSYAAKSTKLQSFYNGLSNATKIIMDATIGGSLIR